MSTVSEQFFERAKEIQRNCCCHEFDEKECFRRRYLRSIDDCFGEPDWDDDFDRCECACHVELGELERDLWPDDE